MTNWTLPDALTLLHRQFPDAFVTSGKRDPNSALGRANPRSYHNVGEAFDIRPMQGVDFDTYVSKLKAAGLPVVEALDEATHPKAWTTGPNWHVAFGAGGGQSPYYAGIQGQGDKPKMLTPQQRAAMFNVDIPGKDPQPFNLQKAIATMPAVFGASDSQIPSGDFSAELAANAAKGEQQKKIPLWAKILGVMGDTYSEVNGRNGTFIPALQDAQKTQQDQNFAREKLQMQLDAQKAELAAKLQEPPQFIQNAQAWAALGPDGRRAVLQEQDAVNPINVSTPQGTQFVPRTTTKTINGKTYYQIGGEWFEESN